MQVPALHFALNFSVLKWRTNLFPASSQHCPGLSAEDWIRKFTDTTSFGVQDVIHLSCLFFMNLTTLSELVVCSILFWHVPYKFNLLSVFSDFASFCDKTLFVGVTSEKQANKIALMTD